MPCPTSRLYHPHSQNHDHHIAHRWFLCTWVGSQLDSSSYHMNVFNAIYVRRTILLAEGMTCSRRDKYKFLKRSLLAVMYILHSFTNCCPMLTSTRSQQAIQQHTVDMLLNALKELDDKMIPTKTELVDGRVYRRIGNLAKATVSSFPCYTLYTFSFKCGLMCCLRAHSCSYL